MTPADGVGATTTTKGPPNMTRSTWRRIHGTPNLYARPCGPEHADREVAIGYPDPDGGRRYVHLGYACRPHLRSTPGPWVGTVSHWTHPSPAARQVIATGALHEVAARLLDCAGVAA